LPRHILCGGALCASWLAAVLPAGVARAQPVADAEAPDPAPSGQQSPIPGPGDSTSPPGTGPSPGQPGFVAGLFGASRSSLLGDLYGARTALGRIGVSLGLQETDEVFGNATGGLRRGASYNGLTALSLGVDAAAAGLAGGVFNVSALQIHGRNYSATTLAALQGVSGIQAQRATRLWEIWYQQGLGSGVDVKLGQQSLDQEFIGSQYSGLFVNAAMGWPLVPSVDQYAGGPDYPLASLGARVRLAPARGVTVLGGVFDDNPVGHPFHDDFQVSGAGQSGTAFSTGTGALAIGEAQYAANQPAAGGAGPAAGATPGLPGTYKLGFWYDTGTFPDQRFDAAGLPLADRALHGVAQGHRGNWSVYGVLDQMVWRPAADSARSVGVFARVMGAPGDRNVADFSLNAGVTLKAPLPGRDNDTLGLGYGLARVGASARGLDADEGRLNGAVPVRSSESFLELTYQYQAAPWLLLQPDVQYVYGPGGGVANLLARGRRVGNEAVFGLRTSIAF